MQRRELLKCALIAPVGLATALTENASAADAAKDQKSLLKLRPHHLLDIVMQYGYGEEFKPSPSHGHAVHIVAQKVLADLGIQIQFVNAADDVCKPCKYLSPDGRCIQGTKQVRNTERDRNLLNYLEIPEGTTMTERQFLQIADKRLPRLATLCLWPSQTYHYRLYGLEQGLKKLGVRPAKADLRSDLQENLQFTDECLQKYPEARKRLTTYVDEVRGKLKGPCADQWMAYQADRMRRIRWLVDKKDDGRKSGFRLRIRPYDIPWLVHAIGSPESYGADKAYNGVLENREKLLNAPEVQVEFTEKFADMCYLCSSLTAEGCARHPEFGDYGKVFPQPVQMSPKLKASSDLALKILGLNWSDVVTGGRLLDLCVEKAPDPALLPSFPELDAKQFPGYRSGIEKWKQVTSRR